MKHFAKRPKNFIPTLLSVALLAPSCAFAKDNGKEKEVIERPRINFQISAPHRSKTYSCDLLLHSYQCREYSIIPSAKHTLHDLQDSCESMGGKFQQITCPSSDQLSQCTEVIRNPHKPDVIYTNIYYGGQQSHWDVESTQRVCGNLGGQWQP